MISQGHRERLRRRFDLTGGKGLLDYEILELILTFAIMRRDTKPAAKALIERFGSLAEVFDASRKDLESVAGIGPRASFLISLLKKSCASYLGAALRKRNIMKSPENVAEYCRVALAGLKHEAMHVLFTDSRNAVVSEDTLFEGTVDQAAVYPRRIIEECLSRHAAGFVLVHNHPSGDVTPSLEDKALTERVMEAARTVDLRFLDHLIVGRSGFHSFREKDGELWK